MRLSKRGLDTVLIAGTVTNVCCEVPPTTP